MEVTLVHPDNKDQKVTVTNQIQYDAFKSRGFVDVPEKEKTDLKAAQTPALKAEPTADASKDVPEGTQKAPKAHTEAEGQKVGVRHDAKSASANERKETK